MVAGRPVLDGAVPGGRASCFTGYWVGLDTGGAEQKRGKGRMKRGLYYGHSTEG